jgi:hypothetical protein
MTIFRRILSGPPNFNFCQFEKKILQFFTIHSAAYEYLITIMEVQGMFHNLRLQGLNNLEALLELVSMVQENKMSMKDFFIALGLTRRNVDALCCVELI